MKRRNFIKTMLAGLVAFVLPFKTNILNANIRYEPTSGLGRLPVKAEGKSFFIDPATWYVDSEYGKDEFYWFNSSIESDGTFKRPFRTIAKAVAKAKPGSQITVIK